jgi:hypothetical protein
MEYLQVEKQKHAEIVFSKNKISWKINGFNEERKWFLL